MMTLFAMVLIIGLNQLELAFQLSKKSLITSTNIPKTSTFLIHLYQRKNLNMMKMVSRRQSQEL
uniref:Uncharacterized protein n=1 Tax=Solanum lycopersicum TaxID=4081 RepID=A0A3Q7JAE7_SOLLC